LFKYILSITWMSSVPARFLRFRASSVYCHPAPAIDAARDIANVTGLFANLGDRMIRVRVAAWLWFAARCTAAGVRALPRP
jgi:hypothetical protein